MEKLLKRLLNSEQEIWLIINGYSFNSKIIEIQEDIITFTYQFYRESSDRYETWERAIRIEEIQGVEQCVSKVTSNAPAFIRSIIDND